MTRYICRWSIPIMLLVTFLAMNCDSNPIETEITLELAWQDEFEGPAGQLPDPTKWDYDIGTDWGNNQLEYDTNRPENVSLDGQGNLTIVAREESYMNRNYTSARIVTRGKFETTYGKIEARVKLPTGQGIWPAFWMLGSNFETVGWPQCGEIDIMEYRGQEPQIIHGSLHGPGYSGGNALTRRYYLADDRFDNDFHVFTVEWTAGEIKWFVDDIHYLTANPSEVDGEWVFDHSFYIILNIAVGGNFVGSPDATTVFPQTMLIDYVRVYQEAN
ncbi:MAG: family 16 glycosylhydrolase [candidate division Zixibacteria bacterium]|nr:family 16 glycosylhydrolase [candidate division Zixibacteria bacterium]